MFNKYCRKSQQCKNVDIFLRNNLARNLPKSSQSPKSQEPFFQKPWCDQAHKNVALHFQYKCRIAVWQKLLNSISSVYQINPHNLTTQDLHHEFPICHTTTPCIRIIIISFYCLFPNKRSAVSWFNSVVQSVQDLHF